MFCDSRGFIGWRDSIVQFLLRISAGAMLYTYGSECLARLKITAGTLSGSMHLEVLRPTKLGSNHFRARGRA